jgi:hypothetical protein
VIIMMAVSIPGYRLGDPALPKSPITTRDLADLKESLLFGEDDVAALRKARGVVEDQVEAILDVWYGFVASKPHLLVYFSDPATGQPLGPYLEAVRKRFGQWILDTCDANYDDGWLAWQDEIGRRHHRTAKNKTDGHCRRPYPNAPRARARHSDLAYDEAVPREEGRIGRGGRRHACRLDQGGAAAGDPVVPSLRQGRGFLMTAPRRAGSTLDT